MAGPSSGDPSLSEQPSSPQPGPTEPQQIAETPSGRFIRSKKQVKKSIREDIISAMERMYREDRELREEMFQRYLNVIIENNIVNRQREEYISIVRRLLDQQDEGSSGKRMQDDSDDTL